MTKAIQVVTVLIVSACLLSDHADAQETNSQEGMPGTLAKSTRGISSIPAASQARGTNQVVDARDTRWERLRDPNWFSLGVLIAVVNSTLAIGVGISVLLRLRRSEAELKNLQKDQHDRLVAEMRQLQLSTTAGLETTSGRMLQSIRTLQVTLDSVSRLVQPAVTGLHATASVFLDSNPNAGDGAPMDCGQLQDELEFLRWLRESAAANREITTVSGQGGNEGRRIHRIRANRVPLTWVKRDMERAVTRLAQLNRYARSVLKLDGSGPCLVQTRQTRLALNDIDSGTPSPWVIEVDVDLLEQVLLETDKLRSAKTTQ